MSTASVPPSETELEQWRDIAGTPISAPAPEWGEYRLSPDVTDRLIVEITRLRTECAEFAVALAEAERTRVSCYKYRTDGTYDDAAAYVCLSAAIKRANDVTLCKSILAAHDATKDAEIVALSAGLRLAHEQMLMAGMGSDEIERTCGLEACRRALELHDEALVKPLVEALRSTGAVLSEMFGDSEDCDSKLPAVMAQIDAALAPHKEIVR